MKDDRKRRSGKRKQGKGEKERRKGKLRIKNEESKGRG